MRGAATSKGLGRQDCMTPTLPGTRGSEARDVSMIQHFLGLTSIGLMSAIEVDEE